MRTHAGEKPFRCDLCGSRFTQRSKLRSHLRTHGRSNALFISVCADESLRIAELEVPSDLGGDRAVCELHV